MKFNFFIFLFGIVAVTQSYHFGEQLVWKENLDDAIKRGEKFGKPVMLLILKSWCSTSVYLKQECGWSEPVKKLSKKFIIVQPRDSDEPTDKIYAPDGVYYPRLFFIRNGTILKDIINTRGFPQYKYYHFDADSVADCMNKTLCLYY